MAKSAAISGIPTLTSRSDSTHFLVDLESADPEVDKPSKACQERVHRDVEDRVCGSGCSL